MPRKAAPKRLKNHFVFVLDASGSIRYSNLTQAILDMANSNIQDAKQAAIRVGQDTIISVMTFDHSWNIRYVYDRADLKNARKITPIDYRPAGQTALFDAIGKAIDDCDIADDGETSFTIIGFTDGEENSSQKYPTAKVLSDRIAQVLKKQRYTIAFQAPKANPLAKMGISTDNIRTFEATEQGVKEAAQANTIGIDQYFTARSSGILAVQNFYQPDLTNLTQKKLAQKLDDLSDQYAIYTVPKSVDKIEIGPFIEEKTGLVYILGGAFYQLSKPQGENVQAGKEILILDKKKTEIYGGSQARQLLGFPQGMEIKVKPGDHGDYEIFIQSTSVNRHLLGGTKVAVKVI